MHIIWTDENQNAFFLKIANVIYFHCWHIVKGFREKFQRNCRYLNLSAYI